MPAVGPPAAASATGPAPAEPPRRRSAPAVPVAPIAASARGDGRGRRASLHGAPFERGRRPDVVRPPAAPRRRGQAARPRPPGRPVSGPHARSGPGRSVPRARREGALGSSSKEENGNEKTVRFRYREADGSGLTRTYVFRDAYVVVVRVEREGAPGSPSGRRSGRASETRRGRSSTAGTRSPARRSRSPRGGSVTRRAKDGLKEPLAGTHGPRRGGARGQLLPHRLPARRAGRVSLRPVSLGARRPRPRRRRRGDAGAREPAPTSRARSSSPGRGACRRTSSSGRRRSTSSRRRGPGSTADRLRLVRGPRQAAPVGAARDPQVRRRTGASRSSSSRS